MSYLYFDIETIPTERKDVAEYVAKKLKAPANYKDPAKIEAWIEKNKDNAVHKTGLSGMFGQVLMIGYAIDDQPADVLFAIPNNEKFIINEFKEIAVGKTLVGHNSSDFDIPFVSQRLLHHGMRPLFEFGAKPWDMKQQDTMLMFACGKKERYSLEALCLAFSIDTPKGGMTGADVYQYYLDGRIDEILEYCKGDVEATRALHQRMIGKKKSASNSTLSA